MEFAFSDPEQRRLHRAVREDPESAWPEIEALLSISSSTSEDELFAADLLEELLYDQAEKFIDRLETLAAASAVMRERIAVAHVRGVAPTPALERFWELQEAIQRELEATR